MWTENQALTPWNTDQFSIAESSIIKQYVHPDEGCQIQYGMLSKILFSDK